METKAILRGVRLSEQKGRLVADLVRGKTATSWPSIRTDLRNAGANVVDQEAVTDGNIVTSRKPEDIPAFTEAFIALVEG